MRVQFLKIFSVQRGTPRESDTAARLEEACLLNLCDVVVQWVTSQPDTVDMTVTFLSSHRRLGPKSDRRENNSHPCAQRTLHPFCVVFILGTLRHGIAEPRGIFLERNSWTNWEFVHYIVDAVSGLAEAVRTMGQSVSKPRPEDMRVGKPEPYAPGKDFDDWDFTFNGYAGTLDPAYPALLKTARQSPTVVMATPPHEQQSATLLYLLTKLTQKGARKVVRKAGNNGWFRSLH